MPPDPSPIARRRELGATLRRYRTQTGLTVKEVAEQLLCDPAKISRIETGQRSATQRDVRDLSDMYGIADPEIREYLMTLAHESRRQGWWRHYDPVSGLAMLVDLENVASEISDYHSLVFPGLLQTADYADAVLRVWFPNYTVSKRKQEVDLRLKRQRILVKDPPPRFSVVLDEAVLHRAVGGDLVMRAQLEHVVEIVAESTITVQIIPFSTGAHLGMTSSFTLLDFADRKSPSIVYLEEAVNQVYVDRPDDVEHYRQIHSTLCHVALRPAESMRFIHEASRRT
jgi:transcriptional regulator with XRE-family HTH domain